MKLLSIIIPTLNEVNHLRPTIDAINKRARSSISKEIIVVDSGSVDGTQDLTRQLKARLMNYKPKSIGKFGALNFGAKQAKGEVLLFLDADSIVPDGYDELIRIALENPCIVGGAFEFALNGPEYGLRFVEWMNRLRYRIWPRYYGDQGIFVCSDIFHKVGGYPSKSLLEASHLCMNLRKKGALSLIRHKIYTSPRRFIEGGIFRVFGADFKIWWMDLMNFSTEKFARSYWKNNQMREKSNFTDNVIW